MSGSESAPTDNGTAPFAVGILYRTVLDKGIVSLKDAMGDDKSIARAARVSNGVLVDKGLEADKKLINYLVEHRHGSPFEHVTFTFYIKCPLFVRSEWMRHRMASYNEISGRYVEYEPEFYKPWAFRKPASSNKQGSVAMDADDAWQLYPRAIMEANDIDSYYRYTQLLHWGVAREMARMVLPVNLYTQFYFTVNARGLMNFLSLRTGDDAQWEIRQYADAIENIFENMLPLTHKAWAKNGRVSP